MLESLVNPAAEIAPGYGTASLTLKDGGIIVGRLAGQDDESVSIADPETQKIAQYDRELIQEMSQPVTIMPPVAYLLTKKELRDVIAYLVSLKE